MIETGRSRVKASVTVFLSFVVLLMAAVIFSLLESARVSGMKSFCQMDAMLTVDNLFAEYQRELWADYDLLFLDGSYGSRAWSREKVESRTMEFSLENCGGADTGSSVIGGGAVDFYSIMPVQAELTQYEFATDHDGQVFRSQAARAMVRTYGASAAEKLYDVLGQAEEADEAGSALEQSGNRALERLEDAYQVIQEQQTGSGVSEETGEEAGSGGDMISSEYMPEENPLELLKKMKKQGILVLTAPQMDISEKEMDVSDTLLRRDILSGTYDEQKDGILSQTAEEVLFFAYLDEHYSNAVNVKEGGDLDYELEYIIAGRGSDADNLKAVVRRLLLMREGANALYLQSDAEKQALLYEAALAISVATGTEALVPVIKQGLLLAWAYAESIADVRVLLQGGKIPLNKTSADWMTDLLHLSRSLNEATQKQHDRGLSYVRYLQMILFLMKDRTVNYRSMDLLEARARVSMDCMMQRIQVDMSYQGEPLFWSMVSIGDGQLGTYHFSGQREIDYME